MRSRVNKNQALYTQIASDTESKVESQDLSYFANRLNAIDEQFGKMDVSSETNQPNHARELQRRYHEEQKDSSVQDIFEPSVSDLDSLIHEDDHLDSDKNVTEFDRHNEFDTFESTYLSDFLQEVKEYNVKQGYREMDNTSTNIMKDLNLDIEINKSRQISDTVGDTPFIPEDIDDLLEQIDPLIDTIETPSLEPVSFSDMDDYYDNIEQTKYFTAVDHMQRFDQEDAHLQETIAMEVLRMVDEDDEDVDYGANEVQLDLDLSDSIGNEKQEDVSVEHSSVEPKEEVVPVTSNNPEDYKLTPFGMQPIKETPVSVTEPVSTDEQVDEVNEPLDAVEETSVNEFIESSVPSQPSPITHNSFEELDVEDTDVTRRLLEQTQTLQIKVIDQEKNIEEISDTMVRTNRLLNVTLSLLMLAIFVVIMLIVSNILGR